MTELAASPELGQNMVKATKKVREAVYRTCCFYNVDLRERLDEHKLTSEKYLLRTVELLSSHASYNV